MKTTVIVPPIKCQGIKTKLVSLIKSLADQQNFDRWIEPFCGSGVGSF
jgi:DNA adenine methylase